MHATEIIQTDSGFELRAPRLDSDGRRRYRLSKSVLSDVAAFDFIAFGMCRHGSAFGFRFSDIRDYTSHQDGQTVSTLAADRINIGTGTGTQTRYPVFKYYRDDVSTLEFERKITRLVAGTVSVWVDDVLQVEGTDYYVDTQTGTIGFVTAPGAELDVDVTYQFDTPVRFGESVDEWLEAEQAQFANTVFPTIDLIEVVDQLEGDERRAYGGTFDGGNYAGVRNARFEDGALQSFNPLDAQTGTELRLWDPSASPATPTGGPVVTVRNQSLSFAMSLRTAAGVLIVSVPANNRVTLIYEGTSQDWRYY